MRMSALFFFFKIVSGEFPGVWGLGFGTFTCSAPGSTLGLGTVCT